MEKNYKRKMLVIGVLFLFLGASATLTAVQWDHGLRISIRTSTTN